MRLRSASHLSSCPLQRATAITVAVVALPLCALETGTPDEPTNQTIDARAEHLHAKLCRFAVRWAKVDRGARASRPDLEYLDALKQWLVCVGLDKDDGICGDSAKAGLAREAIAHARKIAEVASTSDTRRAASEIQVLLSIRSRSWPELAQTIRQYLDSALQAKGTSGMRDAIVAVWQTCEATQAEKTGEIIEACCSAALGDGRWRLTWVLAEALETDGQYYVAGRFYSRLRDLQVYKADDTASLLHWRSLHCQVLGILAAAGKAPGDRQVLRRSALALVPAADQMADILRTSSRLPWTTHAALEVDLLQHMIQKVQKAIPQ